ncbi:TNF receptor-associated factor 5 isoform X5 [Melanerpes formicivorus]|uniref:TNF receptor-associated factor 5 isoform X5 n=1 Tax=Melanerpes formicivorus TaxID=211600 RepID=UPI00358E50ED
MACDEPDALSGIFMRQNSASAVSLDFEPDADYNFVETLEDRYRCAYCHLVLHNPHQTGCGHRFCQQCIVSLRELNAVPTCPVDKEAIKMHEVFKDNCCKREVLNLPVFCKNTPDCNSKIILGRYQEHLQQCLFERVQCTNDGCGEQILRKDLKEHLSQHCQFREERCQYCDKYVVFINIKISDLHKSLECKEIKIQQLAEAIKKCEKEFRQFTQLFGNNSNLMVSTQALASHLDKSARLESQVKQLIQMANQQQSKLDLRPLFDTIENVKQTIALMETYDQRLVVLEDQSSKHDLQINIHKAQLNKNEERFKLLEGTCYNGKLIWKITDYRMKKKEAVEGRVLSIFSQPFYTSRCGYRLCARAYLNGDGSGKGTHVSLYFVVMRGEFDSLLLWPFKQKVTLMLLDQSGKKNHIVEVFRADPNSSSFKRPDGEMNIASGCPRFVSHAVLESTKNTYIRDDTLFLKVVVDLTDLEEL